MQLHCREYDAALADLQGVKGRERGSILRAMAAQFKLLSSCERVINGNLEGIDALLGECLQLESEESLQSVCECV